MMLSSIPSKLDASQTGGTSPRETQDDRIGQAAAQFESLFLAQMLRSARASDGGLGNGDESNQTMMEVAEEQIAQALANSGGLGLGKSIADSLRTQSPQKGAAPPGLLR